MENNKYPNLTQWMQMASEDALRELSSITGMFKAESYDKDSELHFWNGRRSIGIALLQLKEADISTTLITQHKDTIRQWKKKQNLQKSL